MTLDELTAAYWTAMDAAHRVDVVTAQAKHQVATAVFESSRLGEQYNAALSQYLIDHKVPSGYHVDLFGSGKVKLLAECKLTPDVEK